MPPQTLPAKRMATGEGRKPDNNSGGNKNTKAEDEADRPVNNFNNDKHGDVNGYFGGNEAFKTGVEGPAGKTVYLTPGHECHLT